MSATPSSTPTRETLISELESAYKGVGYLTAAATGNISYHVRERLCPFLGCTPDDFKLLIVIRAGVLDVVVKTEDTKIIKLLKELGFDQSET